MSDIQLIEWPYTELNSIENLSKDVILGDHLNGFDQNFNNSILENLDTYAKENNFIYKIYYICP